MKIIDNREDPINTCLNRLYIYIYIYRIEFKLYHMQIIMIQILTTYGYNL